MSDNVRYFFLVRPLRNRYVPSVTKKIKISDSKAFLEAIMCQGEMARKSALTCAIEN